MFTRRIDFFFFLKSRKAIFNSSTEKPLVVNLIQDDMSLTRCSSPSPIFSPIPPISLFSLVFIFSLLSFHLLDMNINKPCPPIIISHPATSVSTVSSQFTQFSFFRPTYPTISPFFFPCKSEASAFWQTICSTPTYPPCLTLPPACSVLSSWHA